MTQTKLKYGDGLHQTETKKSLTGKHNALLLLLML